MIAQFHLKDFPYEQQEILAEIVNQGGLKYPIKIEHSGTYTISLIFGGEIIEEIPAIAEAQRKAAQVYLFA